MPSKIQTIPSGLLDALGIKSTGVNPSALPDHVQSGIDILELYLADSLAGSSTTANVTAPGNSVTKTVNSGEAWWLRAVDCYCIPGIGNRPWLSISVGLGANFTRIAAHQGTQQAASANDIYRLTATLPQPLLLLPGTSIVAQFDGGSIAAATALTVTTLHSVLRL